MMPPALIEMQQTLHEEFPLWECPKGPEFVGNILQPADRETKGFDSLFTRRELIGIAKFDKFAAGSMPLQQLGDVVEHGEPV